MKKLATATVDLRCLGNAQQWSRHAFNHIRLCLGLPHKVTGSMDNRATREAVALALREVKKQPTEFTCSETEVKVGDEETFCAEIDANMVEALLMRLDELAAAGGEIYFS